MWAPPAGRLSGNRQGPWAASRSNIALAGPMDAAAGSPTVAAGRGLNRLTQPGTRRAGPPLAKEHPHGSVGEPHVAAWWPDQPLRPDARPARAHGPGPRVRPAVTRERTGGDPQAP